MFSKLNKTGKEKIKFFDAILSYLANNYSKEITLDDIMSNIDYNDSRIRKLSAIDSFFEADNIKQTYKKSLELLSDSGYIINKSEKYYLTVNGLTIVTANGLLAREKRDISKYNFQNWIWFVMILNIVISLSINLFSSSKPSTSFYIDNHHTNHKQKDTDTLSLQKEVDNNK